MDYVWSHTRLWWCWWDIPAAIILIAVIIYCLIKIHKQKKERNEISDRLDEYREAVENKRKYQSNT